MAIREKRLLCMYFDVCAYLVVVCVFIHVCACVLPHICTCGSQRMTEYVFPYYSPPLFCRQVILLNVMLAILTRLAGQQALCVCLSLSPQHWG